MVIRLLASLSCVLDKLTKRLRFLDFHLLLCCSPMKLRLILWWCQSVVSLLCTSCNVFYCRNFFSLSAVVIFMACSIFLFRVSGLPLLGRWNWIRNGNSSHFKDKRRVPRSNDAHFLSVSITKGVRHSCRTLQCNSLSSPTRWERRWMYGPGQWGSLWHLLPDLKAHNPKL